jgi:hypothetical protein
MDLFKFIPGADPSFLTNGQALNKIKTAQWTERYVDPGEFEITAGVSSGLRELLPVGSMISHIDTFEVMIVETVNLKEDDTDSVGEPRLIIRGRSLESWFRQRIVGADIETYIDPGDGYYLMLNVSEYALAMDTSWEQTKTMIEGHVTDTFAGLDDDVDGFAIIANQQHIGSSTSQARIMRKQNLHSAVMELLAVDDFGIKVVRPNPDNVDPTKTEFRIHNGVDRTESVIFSNNFGDLEKPEYLWGDGALKTDFFCRSNFFEMRSDSVIEGFNRRLLYVDCTDLDEHLDIEDALIEFADIQAAMHVRGHQALRAQAATNLMSTDISRRSRYKFKTHYDVGDIVSVHGNYDEQSVMRVVEHVRFLDEKGETGYPTLAAVNE